MAHQILRNLNEGVRGSFYVLICDEYTDISDKEQLTLCLSWIDRTRISLEKCRGQCYDGASNMLGKESEQVLDIQPKAYVTHCHCHPLSLAVNETARNDKRIKASFRYDAYDSRNRNSS